MEMLWEYGKAFVVGGLICLVGQILIDKTKLTPARILVLFVTLGVVLTAVGLYGPLVDFAGAGATVPLTGFGYTMAKGVVKANPNRGRHRGRCGNCGSGILRVFGGADL